MPEMKRSIVGPTSIGIGETAYEFNMRHYCADRMERI